jgi:hypothetical protein
MAGPVVAVVFNDFPSREVRLVVTVVVGERVDHQSPLVELS